MTPVFVDTSYLLAVLLSDDEHHARAVKWQAAAKAPLLTTEHILVELLDAMTAPHLRPAAVNAVALLRSEPTVQVIPASTALLDDGLALFADRADKNWGITDCISFRVMQTHGMHEALSSDHHFEQAGFVALLRHDPPADE